MLTRVLVWLAALVGVAVTARLGWWQLERARTKDAWTATIEARATEPVLQTADLVAAVNAPDAAHAPGAPGAPASSASLSPAVQRPDVTRQHHRLARLEGQWLGTHTRFLDNRPQKGRAGFIVLTPLQLDDGSVVIVQRGWQPRDLLDRTRTQPVPHAEGQRVRVQGRVAPPPSRLMEFDAVDTGPIRQNVDIMEWARESGWSIRPVSLLQLEPALVCSSPGAPSTAEPVECNAVLDDGLHRQWPLLASSSDKNRGYAVQWFSLSALLLGLLLWFQVLQPWRRARAS